MDVFNFMRSFRGPCPWKLGHERHMALQVTLMTSQLMGGETVDGLYGSF